VNSKKGPKGHGQNPRSRPRPRARPTPPTASGELPEADYLGGLDEAVRDPHPLALLMFASGVAALLDPRQGNPMDAGGDNSTPTLAELIGSFLAAGLQSTDNLLLVLKEFVADDLLQRRIRREVAARKHPVPGWLLRLDQVRPDRVVESTHILGDGDNVFVGVQLPGKREITLIIYIDHNLGTIVKDAFVLNQSLDETIEVWRRVDQGATTVRELTLADARARIEPAIEQAALMFPPFESETWPMVRPLTEWVTGMMPDGGAGYQRPEWSEAALDQLKDDFCASEWGAVLDDEDHRSLLGDFLWFATDYGPGDPLRWSPVAVEMILEDWIPRKIVADVDYLTSAPDLLRALIRYSHSVRGVPEELTLQTLAAVDECEPEYQKVIRTTRHQGALALLERIGALGAIGHEIGDREDAEDQSLEEYLLSRLASQVGGPDALDRLDVIPLPDEPLAVAGLPADIVDRVQEVGDLVDGCAAAFFDTQFRTAARRVLARAAASDPAIFRRQGKPGTAAAAICWIVGKANGSFDPVRPRVQDMMDHFGLKGSPSQRATSFVAALGLDWHHGRLLLRDPTLLTSSKRGEIVTQRDQHLDRLARQR